MKSETLIRVHGLSNDRSRVKIEVFAWRSELGSSTVEVPLTEIPDPLRPFLRDAEFPIFMKCKAKIWALKPEHLELSDFVSIKDTERDSDH